jgi:hypothetical protein
MDDILAWLYPNRIAFAIASLAVAIIVALIGWRRGWQHTARRHPRSTMIGLLVVLVSGLPVAWYLASPLVIRTALVEPAPVAVVASPAPIAPAAGALGTSTAEPVTPAPAQPSATPVATPVTREPAGRFVGADDFHFARGTARLVQAAPGRFAVRFEDFSVRNGPDLFVYLSPDPDGYAKGAIELGKLKATDGSFNYALPADIDVGAARSVVIWCKAFSVQFGVAELKA